MKVTIATTWELGEWTTDWSGTLREWSDGREVHECYDCGGTDNPIAAILVKTLKGNWAVHLYTPTGERIIADRRGSWFYSGYEDRARAFADAALRAWVLEQGGEV